MTWRPPWWVAPVAVLVAVLAVVWGLNRGRNAARELEAAREAFSLEMADLNVAHQVERDALTQDLIGEATASAALAAELARIQAAAPGATPVATAHGTTGALPVGPAAGSAPTTPPAAGMDSPSVPASCPPCRLAAGDGLEIRGSGAVLRTDLGNVAVAAVASAWRHPAGGAAPELLVEGPLRLEVKVESSEVQRPGWGGGPLVGAFGGPGGGSWILGGLVATPSVRLLFGVEGSLVAGGGVGPSGGGGGFLSVLFR